MKRIRTVCCIGILISLTFLVIAKVYWLPEYYTNFIGDTKLEFVLIAAAPLFWYFIGILVATLLLENIVTPKTLRYIGLIGIVFPIVFFAAWVIGDMNWIKSTMPGMYNFLVTLIDNPWIFSFFGAMVGIGSISNR